MTENIRFFKIVDVLKKQKELADYVELAGILNTNKAGISDIKQGRKKLSIDNIRSMKISYPKISIDYIIMGEGEMFITPSANIVPVEVPSQKESPVIDKLFSTLEKKDQRIEELLKDNVRLDSNFLKLIKQISEKLQRVLLLETLRYVPTRVRPLPVPT